MAGGAFEEMNGLIAIGDACGLSGAAAFRLRQPGKLMAARPTAKSGVKDSARGYGEALINSSVIGCKADIVLALSDFSL
jgi:hypothetical protein